MGQLRISMASVLHIGNAHADRSAYDAAGQRDSVIIGLNIGQAVSVNCQFMNGALNIGDQGCSIASEAVHRYCARYGSASNGAGTGRETSFAKMNFRIA